MWWPAGSLHTSGAVKITTLCLVCKLPRGDVLSCCKSLTMQGPCRQAQLQHAYPPCRPHRPSLGGDRLFWTLQMADYMYGQESENWAGALTVVQMYSSPSWNCT